MKNQTFRIGDIVKLELHEKDAHYGRDYFEKQNKKGFKYIGERDYFSTKDDEKDVWHFFRPTIKLRD